MYDSADFMEKGEVKKVENVWLYSANTLLDFLII